MTWTDDTTRLPPGISAGNIADIAAQIGEAGQAAAFSEAQAAAEALADAVLIDASEFATAAVRIHLRIAAAMHCRRIG